MTHTLHRRGNPKALRSDYVVLVMSAKGFNDKGASRQLSKALHVIEKHNPVNLGDMKTGSLYAEGMKTVYENIKDTSILHGVFKNQEDMQRCVAELERSELGMSVVVSGLFDDVFQASKNVGIEPHTVQYSLGTFGNLSLLAREDALEITTMCGHHLVSPLLVRKLVSDVKAGRTSLREAAKTLAKQCVCGVFNPDRAEIVLQSMMK